MPEGLFLAVDTAGKAGSVALGLGTILQDPTKLSADGRRYGSAS